MPRVEPVGARGRPDRRSSRARCSSRPARPRRVLEAAISAGFVVSAGLTASCEADVIVAAREEEAARGAVLVEARLVLRR